MPLPKNLEFDDRLAPYTHPTKGPGHYFICRRRGHGIYQEFVPGYKTDAKDARTEHDNDAHVHGRRALRDVPIEQLCDEWLAHMEKLEVEGVRDPATTRHYELLGRYLKAGMHHAGVRRASDLDASRLSDFIRWMRLNTRSKGAMIIDALSALQTMLRWKWIPVDWKIPHDEIRAQSSEKRELDADTIRRVIAAMPEGSLEQAAAYLKARTGARDVEIYTARKEEFDLDASIDVDGKPVRIGIFRPVLHNKGRATKRTRHVYVITSDAAEKVRPFVERAAAGGYVFVERTGRHVTRESMRARIRAASRSAGIVKQKKNVRKLVSGELSRFENTIGAIDSLAQIRAEVATLVEEHSTLRDASDQMGHKDTATTLRWYLKDRLTAKKIAERFRPAEIIAKAIPLGHT